MKNSRTTASKQTLNIWSVWSAVFVEFEKMFAKKKTFRSETSRSGTVT